MTTRASAGAVPRTVSGRSAGHSRTAWRSHGRRPNLARSRPRSVRAPGPRQSARDTVRRHWHSAHAWPRGWPWRQTPAYPSLVFPAKSRWTPPRKWLVLPPVRLAARDRAPGSRRPADSRERSRGPHRWPLRSVAPASPSGRVQELVAASGDPRRSSFQRGTMGPSPSSTSRPPSVNGGICGVALMVGFGCPPRQRGLDRLAPPPRRD